MEFSRTELPGVVVVDPKVWSDQRGFFLEFYHAEKFRRGGIDARFVQDNHSYSVEGTLRGLHGQCRSPQGKFLRVIRGAIYDVAVDLRRSSPTFKRWLGLELSAENRRMVYIPPGLVHGFCVTSDVAEIEYKCTAVYDPEDEFGVVWNDPDLAIDWPTDAPILSEKDASFPRLAEILDTLPEYPV